MNPRKNRLLDLMPALALLAAPGAGAAAQCSPLLAHEVSDIAGGSENLCQYAGKVVLVVNTASYCGYTPQYKGLQALNEKYKSRGLVILGFPSNDFGNQEPGSDKEIADFCDRTYAVKFAMFSKTSVKEPGGSAVFDGLAKATGERPEWNFHKYLISRDGTRVASFASKVEPDSREFTRRVEEFLGPR
jgi:glutathione peroxidase